jgi:hypothetical protein
MRALMFLAAIPLCAQVSITVTPASATLYAGQTATFQATIGGSKNYGSSSAISPNVGILGVTPQAQLGDKITYTAPAVIAGQQTVTITSTAHADASKTALATITLMPAAQVITTTDPVLAALQAAATSGGSTLYADLAGCIANNSTCKLLAVVYSCFPPNPWKTNTTYMFGDLVSDGIGNVFKLTSIAPGTANSGNVPVWTDTLNTVTQNGGYGWTMVFPVGSTYTCADATVASLSTVVSSVAGAQ